MNLPTGWVCSCSRIGCFQNVLFFFFSARITFLMGPSEQERGNLRQSPVFLTLLSTCSWLIRPGPNLYSLCPSTLPSSPGEREASPPPGPHYCCMPNPRKEVNSHFKSDFEVKRSAVFEEDTFSGPPILHFKVNTAIL